MVQLLLGRLRRIQSIGRGTSIAGVATAPGGGRGGRARGGLRAESCDDGGQFGVVLEP